MQKYIVGLGFCGPTDCCLTLTGPEGLKEYLIDSPTWMILDKYWDVKKGGSYIDPALAMWIWDNRQEDERKV